MRSRHLLPITVALAAMLVSLLASAAGATVGRAEDPAGDVPSCKGDLRVGGASWDANLYFFVATACDSSPYDVSWYRGDSDLEWAIDRNGDGAADAVVYLEQADSGFHGDLESVDGTVLCEGAPSWSGSTGLAVSFDAGCLDGSFRFIAALTVDENPYGATCICATDLAPDTGWSEPVQRGMGSPPPPAPATGKGYWMVGRTGDVHAFGSAKHFGDNRTPFEVVDLEPTPSGNGYWVLDAAGTIGIHGDAGSYGWVNGLNPLRAGERATAMSSTKDGKGYWIFTSLGRVFAFGDAPFFGDMAGTALNGPVLDSIPTASGNGYYMVASDGGIFTFGDAVFLGSMGATKLNAPVQSLVPDADGRGYWLVASDGGIFSFDAAFYGSMGGTRLNKPITGMVGFGRGYLMVAEDGGIFSFGEAPFYGSLGDHPPAQPIVSTAVLDH